MEPENAACRSNRQTRAVPHDRAEAVLMLRAELSETSRNADQQIAVQVVIDGVTHAFDSFECAFSAFRAPTRTAVSTFSVTAWRNEGGHLPIFVFVVLFTSG